MNRSFSLPQAVLLTACLVATPAMADIYVGGALGQGRITASDPELGADQFRKNHSAFKILGGVRGALDLEFAYMDFGKTRGDLGGDTVSGKLDGLAAFAKFDLPVPVLDAYAKLGMARLDTRVTGDLLDFSSRNTSFAWGLGAEFKAGSIGIRAEYERFRRDGRDPTLLSLGFVKYLGD